MNRPPADREFLSGERGDPGPLAHARDRLLDARLRLARAGPRLDRLAERAPRRRVLVVGVHRPDGGDLPAATAELQRTRHELRIALGARGQAVPELAAHTVATGLAGGKFGNLNAVVAALGDAAFDGDWTLVIDEDVLFPPRFLDRFLAVCDHLDLTLAQPAQSRASFAAWPQVRRRGGAMARETRFVEIGPVTAFRRDAWAELAPFPTEGMGWGLDLHWGAVAAERGWRLGVVDAVPVRHEHGAVAAGYSSRESIEDARRFLSDRPFLDSERARETVRTHPLP